MQEETGDKGEYRKYLRDHGCSVSTTDMKFTFDPNSQQGGFTTQKLDKNDLVISISLSTDCYYQDFFGKLTWNWGRSDLDDIGDNPRDGVGLMWKQDSWRVPTDGGTYGSSYIGNADSPVMSPTGLAFTYHDGNDVDFFGGGGADRWVAADLKKQSDNFTASGRQLWAEYCHAWGGGRFESIDVIDGDLELTTDGYGYTWYKGTDENGNKLITSEADSTVNCTGL
ncbi:hypothetical protein [Haladaptatus sp. R4]|uniref:hypothetical protein n=1 Tax=Haladaptatus sp. R4 TaxID=1679489 RepID=UPI001237587D|nr:hypothetical protein [Haladaptatus sp. R4]